MKNIKRFFSNVKSIRILIKDINLLVIVKWLVIIIISAILTPVCTWLFKFLIDIFSANSNDVKYVIQFIFIYISMEFIVEILEVIESHIEVKVRYYINDYMIKTVNNKVNKISLMEFERPNIYNLVDRINKNVCEGAMDTIGGMLAIISPIITLVSYLIVICSVNVFYAAIIIVASLPYIIYIYKQSIHRYDQQVELSSDKRKLEYINTVLTDRKDAKDLRVFKLVDYLSEKAKKIRGIVYTKELKLGLRQVLGGIMTDLLRNLSLGICLIMTCYSFIEGKQNSIGNVMLLITAIQGFTSNINTVVTNLSSLNDFSLYFNDWREYMQLPEEKVNDNFIDRYNICFDNVSFKYPNSNKCTLDKIKFEIYEKETIAIVGENGSGKSTLINLLLGIYEPTGGSIRIGNYCLQDVLHNFRDIAVCIFQNFNKYQMSVEDNLKAGNIGYENSGFNKTFIDFNTLVDSLPKKEKTMLGQLDSEGRELSGGQWQKIAIARGLYRENTKILIMDEPTASLDPSVENKIYKGFSELCKDKTTILISHRLSAAKLCDRILVIDNGRIVEQGNHKELMRLRGKYFEMFTTQSLLYKE